MALIASTSSEPWRIEELVHHRDDVVLAHAGLELLVHQVIRAVDHRGGAIEQRDLVGRLDLARLQHHLLAVLDLQPRLLQFEHHRRLDDVDADRQIDHAGLADQRGDLAGVPRHQAERGLHRAAQAEQPGLAVLRLEPRRIELVVHRGRAEVPQDRVGRAARQQRPAADLVALPLADLGRGEIADVVGVHHQQRAEIGLLQRHAGAREAIVVQAAVIDALLEIDAHGAERRQRAPPVVARVDVLGGDLADGIVHGLSPSIVGARARSAHYSRSGDLFAPQSRCDARSAPSRRVFSFGHTMLAATHSRPAKVPKPQSVDAMTRSRSPIAATASSMRRATTSGCSTKFEVELDHARDQDLVLRKRMRLERRVFVLVARIGELDRQRARGRLVEHRQHFRSAMS